MKLSLYIAPADPLCTEAQQLLDALSDTLCALTGSSGRASFDAMQMRQDGACFVLARNTEGKAVGCGAFRPLQRGVAELKRMYASTPGQGIGRAVLQAIELRAHAAGYREIWLATRVVNTRATAFYQAHGYRPIANFGTYVGRTESCCFAKTLPQEHSSHG